MRLDHRVQFLRADPVDDGYASVDGVPQPHGEPQWAGKQDISDGERARAGGVSSKATARFLFRWSAFVAGITDSDSLVCSGVTFQIVGIKQGKGRRRSIEFTVAADDIGVVA